MAASVRRSDRNASLSPTALVNEAWLKLAASPGFKAASRLHFKRIAARAMVSNKTPTGTYRAPGRFEGCFFCERLIDLAARDLGLDPLDLRRRNLLTAAEMPHRLPPIVPDDGQGKVARDSGARVSAIAASAIGSASSARLWPT